MCRIRHYFRGNQVQDPNPISASTQFHTGRMPFQVRRGSPRAGVQLIACSLLICRPFLVTLLICSVICRLPWVAHTSHHAYATSAHPRAHICFSRSANVNCLWGTKKKKRRERKEEKYNPRYRKHCANICFKISSTCQRQAATGEMAERENSGKRGSTEARKNGKLRQVRSVGIFICPGSLSTQFDLISARFIYLWFFSLQRSKRTEARKNEIWI